MSTISCNILKVTEQTFTCSKSTIVTREKGETCSKLIIKTSERRYWSFSSVSIVDFVQVIVSWVGIFTKIVLLILREFKPIQTIAHWTEKLKKIFHCNAVM